MKPCREAVLLFFSRLLGMERPVAAEVPAEIADDYREATRIA
jgi:hypothetical protein